MSYNRGVVEIPPELSKQLSRSKVMSSIRSSGNRTTESRIGGLVTGRPLLMHWPPAAPADACLPLDSVALMVHGCFWHGCHCQGPRRDDKWLGHLIENRLRDLSDDFELRRRGWDVRVVWEHELAGVRCAQDTVGGAA